VEHALSTSRVEISAQKMEAECPTETSVSAYKMRGCQNSENQHLNNHCHEYFETYTRRKAIWKSKIEVGVMDIRKTSHEVSWK
jgi:hypothetical protein